MTDRYFEVRWFENAKEVDGKWYDEEGMTEVMEIGRLDADDNDLTHIYDQCSYLLNKFGVYPDEIKVLREVKQKKTGIDGGYITIQRF